MSDTATPVAAPNLTALIWARRGQDDLPLLLRQAADWIEAQGSEQLIIWHLVAQVREDSQHGDECSVVLTVEQLGGDR